LLLHISGIAQHDPYSSPVWSNKEKADYDSGSLWHAFKNGNITGHFRQFSMGTINNDSYPDYYALAIGGGIRYQTANFHHFKFTLSGYFIYNLSSSNLADADETTGVKNRYEVGLFDVEYPSNSNDLDRLEELNLSYTNKGFQAIVGKQLVNTPFINPQDGRMRPTEVGGLWLKWKPVNTVWNLEAGLLNNISPRSTVKWYSVARSMGIYPQGVNPDGSKSDYHDSLQTAGIAYASGTVQVSKHFSVQIMDQFVENIFNTSMIQVNFQYPVNKRQLLIVAAQYTRQDAVANGGNNEVSKAYFVPGQSANVWSARTGIKSAKWQGTLNFTRIAKSGRFLMPREWGREPFFTFMQRERNEGLGNVTDNVLKGTRTLPKNWSIDAALGLFDLPDVKDYTHNKYGMPSYGQVNMGVSHVFKGALKGLQADLLYAYKWNRGNTYNNAKFEVNKVNMSNMNLVLNYQF